MGAAFNPGIEAGYFFVKKSNWAQPYGSFRFAAHVEAGDVTARMAIPWQADFRACAGNWWPVPRPNDVIPKGAKDPQGWVRGWVTNNLTMVQSWDKLGFVVGDRSKGYYKVERVVPPPRELPPLGPGQWNTLAEAGLHSAIWQGAEDLTGMDLACYGRGELPPGETHEWPVLLTEEDRTLTITIRTADPEALSVRVTTPLGPDVPPEELGFLADLTPEALVLHIDLPVEVYPNRFAHDGQWDIKVSAPTATATAVYQLTAMPDSDIRIGTDTLRGDGDGVVTMVTELGDRPVELAFLHLTGDGAGVPLELLAVPGGVSFSGGVKLSPEVTSAQLRVAGASDLGYPFIRERFVTVGDRK